MKDEYQGPIGKAPVDRFLDRCIHFVAGTPASSSQPWHYCHGFQLSQGSTSLVVHGLWSTHHVLTNACIFGLQIASVNGVAAYKRIPTSFAKRIAVMTLMIRTSHDERFSLFKFKVGCHLNSVPIKSSSDLASFASSSADTGRPCLSFKIWKRCKSTPIRGAIRCGPFQDAHQNDFGPESAERSVPPRHSALSHPQGFLDLQRVFLRSLLLALSPLREKVCGVLPRLWWPPGKTDLFLPMDVRTEELE